jgi:hypothetical protein
LGKVSTETKRKASAKHLISLGHLPKRFVSAPISKALKSGHEPK